MEALRRLDRRSTFLVDFAVNAHVPQGIPGAYCDEVGGSGDDDGGGGGGAGLIGAGGTAYAGSVAGGKSVASGGASRAGGSGGSVRSGSGGGSGSVAGSRAGSMGGASVGSQGSALRRRKRFVEALPPRPPASTPVGEPRTFALICAWLADPVAADRVARSALVREQVREQDSHMEHAGGVPSASVGATVEAAVA